MSASARGMIAPVATARSEDRRSLTLLRRARRRALTAVGLPPHTRTLALPDGRLLGYDDLGRPDGVPVLFFHGFGSSRIVRHPDDGIAARLGLRVIAPDRPGIGLSSRQPGRRLLDWPRDVERLVDSLGIERFSIVAWSGGGPYALACAWRLPDRVAQVALISAPAPIAGVPGSAGYTYRHHRAASRAAAVAPWVIRLAMWRWARSQRSDPERALDEAIAGMVEADRVILGDPRLRAVMIANAAEMYRQGGRGVYDEAIIMVRPWGFPLEPIRAPVRIWHGELDSSVPVGMGRYLAQRLGHCQASFYPGEGHHLVYDRWQEILGEVAALSRERLPPPVRLAVAASAG
jgi:pimeloyl-ACP methyl ester carboxylesterase